MTRVLLGIYARYSHQILFLSYRRLVRREALNIKGLAKNQKILVVYDTRAASHGMGNFFGTVMTANAISKLGFRVDFILRDNPNNRRPTWMLESKELQDTIISDFQAIAKLFLETSINFSLDSGKGPLKDNPGDCYLLFGDLVEKGVAFYDLDLRLINELIDAYPSKCDWFDQPRDLDNFVGYHVRFNPAYGQHRNPSPSQIIHDVLAIRDLCPNLPIRIFSSREGLRFSLEVLSGDIRTSHLVTGLSITKQKSANIVEAFREASRAKFWFQRFGGGIGMPPLFSGAKFIVVTDDYYFTRLVGGSKMQLFRWHGDKQLWYCSALFSHQSLRKIATRHKWST